MLDSIITYNTVLLNGIVYTHTAEQYNKNQFFLFAVSQLFFGDMNDV